MVYLKFRNCRSPALHCHPVDPYRERWRAHPDAICNNAQRFISLLSNSARANYFRPCCKRNRCMSGKHSWYFVTVLPIHKNIS